MVFVNGGGEVFEDGYGVFLVDVGIGDGDVFFESGRVFGRYFLVVFVDVGFNYDINDGGFVFVELFGDGGGYFGLVVVVFVRVI